MSQSQPTLHTDGTVAAHPEPVPLGAGAADAHLPTTPSIDVVKRPASSTEKTFSHWETRYAPGSEVQGFRVLELLGEGGMGRVLLADDVQLQRRVALKLLPPDVADEEGRARFIREAHALARIQHNNVVSVFSSGIDDDVAWMALEYVEGDTLADILEQGPIDEATALEICAQAARGLAAVHQQGVIHRDVKPENLLVDLDGTVRVVDFGIALLEGVAKNGFVTQKGVAVGTPHFMSPEQARGAEISEAVDAWAIGATLFQLLSGHPPFFQDESDSDVEILSRVLKEAAPQLEKKMPLTKGTQQVLERLLSKDPEKRGSDLDELAGVLESCADAIAAGAEPTLESSLSSLEADDDEPSASASVALSKENEDSEEEAQDFIELEATAAPRKKSAILLVTLAVVLLFVIGYLLQNAAGESDVKDNLEDSKKSVVVNNMASSSEENKKSPSETKRAAKGPIADATEDKSAFQLGNIERAQEENERLEGDDDDFLKDQPPRLLAALTLGEIIARAKNGEAAALDMLVVDGSPSASLALLDLLEHGRASEVVLQRIALSKREDRMLLLEKAMFLGDLNLSRQCVQLLQERVRNVASIQLLDKTSRLHLNVEIRRAAAAARRTFFKIEGE
ncbi:MAG: serine/threonine protein kinase [Deltaproteobacteria bacterium]|nr:serine/threonine protein kinase [Deltaproteobacteria bacterium]